MDAMACTIPTVDLSPFLSGSSIISSNGSSEVGGGGGGDDDAGRKKAAEIIGNALETYGFFRMVNHGVPPDLMARAIELSRAFFQSPCEAKLEWKPVDGSKSPLPAGYARQPESSPDKNEYLLMFSPESGFNVYPTDPPGFREVLDEIFDRLTKTAVMVEEILNECMGLPPNFFKEYNKDRGCDIMTALRYFPATEAENNGISGHQDGNILTFVLQDGVGGLEVLKDGEWIPAAPEEGAIIVNVGDIIQVLSNGKFKSAMHRVVRRNESRHSFAFFYNLDGGKWIEPLPQFTEEIGEKPKYKGFLYKDYVQLRMRNKTHPPARPEDAIHISHYATSP